MNIQLKENERVKQMLNKWHHEIRKRNIEKSRELKSEIETYIHNVNDDQNVHLHYALLKFRFQYLIDSLSIGKDSFNKIEEFGKPTDPLLSYYYHFFKAMHLTMTGEYSLAKNQYEEAEKKLQHISDELEHAEFYFKLSTFSCHNQQYVLALKQASKAKEIFSKHRDHELNIGYCDNLYGLACIHLKEYELAEEHLISALDIFKKHGDDHASLYSRHNLGFLYGSQNLSELAVRHISEVIAKIPNNYKAILIKACELEKLDNNNEARELFEKGLTISADLQNKEYQHHFQILKGIHENISGEELEPLIMAGNEYFKQENLFEYIQAYNEKLAIKFYKEENHLKASKYFYLGLEAKDVTQEKGALK
ncbi:tetratricopeptide repeat protein [Bacillus cytotoxicus]|uniref:response regulator aspartate phosphatase n=1 Tax=Bacillus cereus group sp. BfR-BA-01492 TaxID=2920361 RepID=UPI001F58CD86|nr:tetratricopeptide repeat protein [Bacillus cereus group sp. BfR-BA-01492]EMA6344554.1 tetratricopeptide repeat protein [Bacillus cytotoxicus]